MNPSALFRLLALLARCWRQRQTSAGSWSSAPCDAVELVSLALGLPYTGADFDDAVCKHGAMGRYW